MRFNRLSQIALLLGLIFAAFCRASADSLEKQINHEYRGKILTLRQFCAGGKLHYDLNGRLVGAVHTTSWTIDAQIEIEKLTLKGDTLELQGRRLRLFFDPSTKELRDASTVAATDPVAKDFRDLYHKKWRKSFIESAKVEVDLDLATGHQVPDITLAIERVFASSSDAVIDLAPSFWRAFLSRKDVSSLPPEPSDDASVEKVGGHVKSPKALFAPDPEYSEMARSVGFSGSMGLTMVVSPEGDVRDISIMKPIGLGLDEKAVEAVGGWKFHPALKDGVPVATRISVNVDFHLY
jgi:TonB family protein